MENQLILFEGEHEVVVLFKDDVNFQFKGDFLIRVKDVSSVLEYERSENVVKLCKPEQVFKVKNSDFANTAKTKLNNTGETFITNLALNRVLGKSEMPKAAPFQDWLYEEMIPSIQKHGAYLTPETIEKTLSNPDFIINLASRLKQANEEKAQLQLKIEMDKPMMLFAESFQVSKDTVLVADLARILKQNGIDIGEKRLFVWMREEGYLIKSGSEYNMPTQRSMNLKIMEIKVGYRGSSDGTTKITRTTKITGKGQMYFINKFKQGGAVI